MTEFKKISDVEVVEIASENDTLVMLSGGVVKQIPVNAFADANLKAITEAEMVEVPEEDDTIVLVSGGQMKQVSAAAFAAASGGGGGVEPIRLIPTTTSGDYFPSNYSLEDGSPVPDNLYDLFIAGTPVLIAPMGSTAPFNVWLSFIGASRYAASGGVWNMNFMFYDPSSSDLVAFQMTVR